jgi:hypothetical protein
MLHILHPDQVYSLVHIYHWAISLWFRKCFFIILFALLVLMYHWFRASTSHGVGPLSSHVILNSTMASRNIMFYLSKWMSFLTALDNRFYWRPLLWERRITAWYWNLKVLFFPGCSIKLLDQEDHKVKWIYHQKEKLYEKSRRPSSFQWSRCSILFLLTSSYSSSFCCTPPSLHKSKNEISFKRRGL